MQPQKGCLEFKAAHRRDVVPRSLLSFHRSPLASGRRAICPRTYTEVNKRPKVTKPSFYMLFAAILTLAFTAGAARADLLTGNPRVCTASTPGGPTRHAYGCAKLAAVAVTRQKMAAVQHVNRWYAPTYCDPVNGDTLRWKCVTILGGDTWTVSVWFRATSSGWKRIVTVT